MKFLQKSILFSLLVVYATPMYTMDNHTINPNLTNHAAKVAVFKHSKISSRIVDFIGGNPDGSTITAESIKTVMPICIAEQETIITSIKQKSIKTISPMHTVDLQSTCETIFDLELAYEATEDKESCGTDYDKIKNVCRVLDLYAFLFSQIPKDICSQLIQTKNSIPINNFSQRNGNIIARYNQSLLQKSIHLKNYKLTELLLNYGANPNEKLLHNDDDCAFNQNSILHLAAKNLDRLSIKLLLAHGADPNIQNRYGETPLYWAILSNSNLLKYQDLNYKNIMPLFTHNADLNIQDNDGQTLLHHLIYWENCKLAAILLSHGANPNIQSIGGHTPLHGAIIYSNYNLAQLLLEHKASPNIRDENGHTPLHHAFDCGNQELIAMLITHRANQNIKDKDGKLPRNIPTNSLYQKKT